MLVQIDKFYFLVDFIVLDTHPISNSTVQIPVILGRPFLATSNALINCRNGVLNLSFGNMTLELNVFNVCNQPAEDSDVHEVDFIEQIIHEQFINSKSYNPLENYLVEFEIDDELENLSTNSMLNSFQGQDRNFYCKPKFE